MRLMTKPERSLMARRIVGQGFRGKVGAERPTLASGSMNAQSVRWRLHVNMDCPLAERLHEESQYGSWHSGAVTFAVQHAQVDAPRTHGRPMLVRHDSGDVVQVSEVVSCPCREQL